MKEKEGKRDARRRRIEKLNKKGLRPIKKVFDEKCLEVETVMLPGTINTIIQSIIRSSWRQPNPEFSISVG